jgi:hypothetical protein
MGTGNGIWLSLSSKAPASTKLHLLMRPDLRGLGRWRLEVVPRFPYLAKLLPPCQLHSLLHAPQQRWALVEAPPLQSASLQLLRPASYIALVDGDWKWHLAFPI